MNDHTSETLSAFLDGEPYDAETLAAALAAPGGREALVDFVLLHGAVADSSDRPSKEFYSAMNRALAPPSRTRRWRATAAAAAVLALAMAGIWSFRTSRPVTDQRSAASTPPAPTRTLHFERGVDWQGQG